jgi:hypothetical protein
MRHIILLLAVWAAGCVQLPPTPQDIQAKRFEPVPGKAVIYIVRPRIDAPVAAAFSLGDKGMMSTHPGTYVRWEAEPGMQRIEGFGASSGGITVPAEAGKIYFVEHHVTGGIRDGTTSNSFRRVDENRGCRLVSDAQMI